MRPQINPDLFILTVKRDFTPLNIKKGDSLLFDKSSPLNPGDIAAKETGSGKFIIGEYNPADLDKYKSLSRAVKIYPEPVTV